MVSKVSFSYPSGSLLPAGVTPGGVASRQAFVSQLHSIVGGADNMRLLWMPLSGDTTSATTLDKDGRTITWDATVAARLSALGSGYTQDFDGTDDEGDTPDVDDLSFGDGLNDSPFSVAALIFADADANTKQIITKYDRTTAATKREWEFRLSAAEEPQFVLSDESSGDSIGRKDSTPLTTSGWALVSGTYDGSKSAAGIQIWVDGARLDDADVSSGSFVAMENTASLVRVGSRMGTAAEENFFNGKMALVMVAAKQLTADEQWALKEAVNSFYGLTL